KEVESSFHGLCAIRLNHEVRRRSVCDMRRRNKIAERAKAAFKGDACFLHRLGVEPDAGELYEMFSIRTGQINRAGVSIANNLPALIQITGRQTKFGGKDIDRADR